MTKTAQIRIENEKDSGERDNAIAEAIERRKSGVRFYTADESLAHMRAAIKTGAANAV